ncbi:LytR C-terminal domain-containing protein [Bifidobacterium avesanii]|uniref:LytR family transcriptional regulator n=1 Tax=Bifidobacterium avesanii TaxID=1798157 RepID=A0A7K3THX8_9BIFI|nr:LytR C-terminal domain-containing protein [Bifidobacterium avesanii]KAB8291985.1 LytR cell envelope-related transcriptional attenuator [Bifidobacterium avesanii]NEG78652.1 LytR family transcriptional regulator [Bifidobacterium avesanii]
MTDSQHYDEREARKAFVRNRQRLVFSIASVVLVVAMVLALLVFYGVIGKSRKADQTKPNFGVTAPCLPDGFDGKRIDPSQIHVRTLNGTDSSGLARAVQDELENRGYATTAVADYPSDTVVSRTTIYFGANAIPEAYTLGSLFTDAALQMDDRQDKLIDVVLGTSFYDLKDSTDPSISDDSPLGNISGCVAAASMQNLPQAIQHDAVN